MHNHTAQRGAACAPVAVEAAQQVDHVLLGHIALDGGAALVSVLGVQDADAAARRVPVCVCVSGGGGGVCRCVCVCGSV
jgi:hypothetical protein